MNKFFIALYDFFESRRALLYALLGALVVAMGAAALQLRFSENITGFFPDGERKAAAAFSNLKIKDKIAVMINAGEDAADKTDEMMACADSLAARLNADTLFRRYAEVEATFGSELADGMRSFLQGNLPLLLSEADYARMDTLVTPRGIAQAMEGNYRRLLSPVGGFIDEYIYDDPLGLSFGTLGKLQELNIGGSYTLCDDYLFSKDMTTLLVFISPHYQSGDTGVGDRLIERIESALEGAERRIRRRRNHGGLLRRTRRGGLQRPPDQARHDADAQRRHPDHRGVHHPLVPQQVRGPAGPDSRGARRAVRAGDHVADVSYDFVDRRRCGDRRNGHRAELFDPHTLPCEPLPRPAADHPRSGLSADHRQHNDHRRLRGTALHRFAAAARLRTVRIADISRNDAFQSGAASPPDP